MLLDLNEGDLVKFLRADRQGGAGVDVGDIGIVTHVGFTFFGVRVGDPDYCNDRIVPIEDAAVIIALHRKAALEGAAVNVWWSQHWQEYAPEPELTKVIFRIWKDHRITDSGDGIIALFPEIPTDYHGLMCQMFEHVGQHGGGNPHDVMRQTRPATSDEYATLKRELEAAPYGYRLEVRQRMTAQMHTARRQEASDSV